MIVCLAANPSVDRLFQVDRLRPGAIHRPLAFVQVPGGKGLNVARAAAALGAEVQAVALLGGHAGRWIEEALAADGVPCRVVWSGGETRSSLSVSDLETRGLTEFYEDGKAITSSGWSALALAVEQTLPGARWLTISGSMPVGAPEDGYHHMVEEGRRAGARTALDASGKPLAEGLPAGPDVVKVNAAEAADLLGLDHDGLSALEAATSIRDLAGGEGHGVLITRGSEGVLAIGPDGSAWEGRLDVQGAYPVGSGDAYLAGLVTALAQGDSWPDAMRVGLAAAAANAELPGAGRLDFARAAELISLAEIQRT